MRCFQRLQLSVLNETGHSSYYRTIKKQFLHFIIFSPVSKCGGGGGGGVEIGWDELVVNFGVIYSKCFWFSERLNYTY